MEHRPAPRIPLALQFYVVAHVAGWAGLLAFAAIARSWSVRALGFEATTARWLILLLFPVLTTGLPFCWPAIWSRLGRAWPLALVLAPLPLLTIMLGVVFPLGLRQLDLGAPRWLDSMAATAFVGSIVGAPVLILVPPLAGVLERLRAGQTASPAQS